MKIIFLTTASAHEKWAELAEANYKEKISHFFSFEKIELRPSKNARAQAQFKLQEESNKILDSIKTDDYVIVFDERGKALDSIQFSKKLEQVLISGKKRCVFVIGGAFGFSDEVRQRADLAVSFSGMVFNHLVAQTVAFEQVYRALTIINGLPYHNG
jgi:23S rRNA (pseudouridine1915-N3)-methyltransferase